MNAAQNVLVVPTLYAEPVDRTELLSPPQEDEFMILALPMSD
jgi:hypothetical protein